MILHLNNQIYIYNYIFHVLYSGVSKIDTQFCEE